MAQQSYAQEVLKKALEIAAASGEATTRAIADAMFVQTRLQQKRLLNALSELSTSGRLLRLRQGAYGPIHTARMLDKREVMWRLLRMNKRVRVDYLVELAEVRKSYALEWLKMLVKREIVRKEQRPGFPGVWILIHDSLDMPEDEDKAAKLREIRKRKKAQIGSRLDAIDLAVKDIRNILQNEERES